MVSKFIIPATFLVGLAIGFSAFHRPVEETPQTLPVLVASRQLDRLAELTVENVHVEMWPVASVNDIEGELISSLSDVEFNLITTRLRKGEAVLLEDVTDGSNILTTYHGWRILDVSDVDQEIFILLEPGMRVDVWRTSKGVASPVKLAENIQVFNVGTSTSATPEDAGPRTVGLIVDENRHQFISAVEEPGSKVELRITRPVLVASCDLDSNSKLTTENVRVEEWSITSIIEQENEFKAGRELASSMEDIDGRRTATWLCEGEAIDLRDVFRRNDLRSISLPPGYSVINVRQDLELVKLLRPRMRVDVWGINQTQPAALGKDVRIFNVGSMPGGNNSNGVVGLFVDDNVKNLIGESKKAGDRIELKKASR